MANIHVVQSLLLFVSVFLFYEVASGLQGIEFNKGTYRHRVFRRRPRRSALFPDTFTPAPTPPSKHCPCRALPCQHSGECTNTKENNADGSFDLGYDCACVEHWTGDSCNVCDSDEKETLCEESCFGFNHNDVCNDGGPGHVTSDCPIGTDCADCSARCVRVLPEVTTEGETTPPQTTASLPIECDTRPAFQAGTTYSGDAGFVWALRDFPLICCGFITEWIFATHFVQPLRLLVYRSTGISDRHYSVVGINDIPVSSATGNQTVTRYRVPAAQRIKVQPGDVYGLGSIEGLNAGVVGNSGPGAMWTSVWDVAAIEVGDVTNFSYDDNVLYHVAVEAVASLKCDAGWAVVTRALVDDVPDLTMVAPGKTVCAAGTITTWAYLALNSAPFRAIVFQPMVVSPGTQFTIVGMNDIPAGQTNVPVFFDVPEAEQITVQIGDVIGWSAGSPSVIAFNYIPGPNSVLFLSGNRFDSLIIGDTLDFVSFDDNRDYSLQAVIFHGPKKGKSPASSAARSPPTEVSPRKRRNRRLCCILSNCIITIVIGAAVITWIVFEVKSRTRDVKQTDDDKPYSGVCLPSARSNIDSGCFDIYTTKKTYQDAIERCERKGATLASIHSEDEHRTLTDMTNSTGMYFWIGLNDRRTEGLFRWTDYTEVDYIKWTETREQNNNDDCVAMDYKQPGWDDLPCGQTHGFICVK